MLRCSVLPLYFKIYIKDQDKCLNVYPKKRFYDLFAGQNGYDETFCLACQHSTHFLEQSTIGWPPDRKPAEFYHLIK